MPEGPEMHRAADRIARRIEGERVKKVFFAFDHLKRFERRLKNKTVEKIEARGKAVLIHFEGGLSVYTHNQLYGRWYVRHSGGEPNTKRTLRFAVENDDWRALLYSASEIEVRKTDEIDEHPYLAKLGPDVLSGPQTTRALRRQIDDKRFRGRKLGGLLLDQSFAAGLGNYLRSEILFFSGLGPELRPVDLTKTQRSTLAKTIRTISERAYATGGITDKPARVKKFERQGVPKRGRRHAVFMRDGKPCHECGTKIKRVVVAGRRLYLCKTCQQEKPAS